MLNRMCGAGLFFGNRLFLCLSFFGNPVFFCDSCSLCFGLSLCGFCRNPLIFCQPGSFRFFRNPCFFSQSCFFCDSRSLCFGLCGLFGESRFFGGAGFFRLLSFLS